jgi:hypothetical protein
VPVKTAGLVLMCAVLYALHQDFWNWNTYKPLVFGFIPIGLFYHACFAVACSLMMFVLVKFAWPQKLEDEMEGRSGGSSGSGGAH